MPIRRWRELLFPAAMDLDQPLKFMCALAALFYPTFRHFYPMFRHCSSSTIPHTYQFAQFVQCTMRRTQGCIRPGGSGLL
jgi:hypothetical protein